MGFVAVWSGGYTGDPVRMTLYFPDSLSNRNIPFASSRSRMMLSSDPNVSVLLSGEKGILVTLLGWSSSTVIFWGTFLLC